MIHAQQAEGTVGVDTPCSSRTAQNEEASSPELVIADLSFWGSDIQMPLSEQTQIATSVKQETLGASLDDLIDVTLEKIRRAWQNHGYFRVHLDGETKILTSSPVSRRIAVSVHVEEGFQYRLGAIRFKNNKTFTNSEALRELFPIEDGEIANREKIAEGLDNLKRAYGSQGFINFVSVPEPIFDDSNRLISLEIDIEEGKQFRVGDIDALGLEDESRQEILSKFLLKRGQIYNENLYKLSIERLSLKLPNCTCRNEAAFHMDDKNGIVDIALDFRPCV